MAFAHRPENGPRMTTFHSSKYFVGSLRGSNDSKLETCAFRDPTADPLHLVSWNSLSQEISRNSCMLMPRRGFVCLWSYCGRQPRPLRCLWSLDREVDWRCGWCALSTATRTALRLVPPSDCNRDHHSRDLCDEGLSQLLPKQASATLCRFMKSVSIDQHGNNIARSSSP